MTSRRRPLFIAAAVVVHLLGIASAIHAVMSTRTPQGAIAWGGALVTVPWVAVPAYWVFGRNRFHGYVLERRAEDTEVLRVTAEVREAVRGWELAVEDSRDPPAQSGAEGLAGLPYVRGNAVELLVDGEATFASILGGIARAERYVLVQFYIVHDDGVGRALKEALIERARAGVRVYFLYDEVGSHGLPESYRTELQQAGVAVHPFGSRRGRGNRFQLNFRNHRKIVVVDGAVAWIGGHNVGDEYLGRDPAIGAWRDTHVRIEGVAALGAQVSFAEDWHWATDERLALDWTPQPGPGDVPVLVLPSGPADEVETAGLMFAHGFASARRRLWIATPYFVPDQAIIQALQMAALRGVDVRILIPKVSDSRVVGLATQARIEEASVTGARFFWYDAGFLHEKVVLLDHHTAAVGTANLDNRSFRLNFEVTAVIVDETFASEVEQMFEADFARSEEVPPDFLDGRPFWYRLSVRLASLLSPIL